MKLHTQRLLLREFVEADVEPMHAWHNDPRYLEHYPVESMTLDDTRALVQRFIDWQRAQPRWRWQLAVTRLDTAQLIGCVGVRRAAVDAPDADVGYELNPVHWGQGYVTEAMGALLTFVFEDIALAEVNARVVDTNAASLRVLQRLGFSHAFDLPPGEGRDGQMWPQRAEYRLSRVAWGTRRSL